MVEIIHKDICYNLNGILFSIHNGLGRFCRHKQYCDALEALLKNNKFKYQREVDVPIMFGEIKLTGNVLDFLIEDIIVLDVKCKKEITTKDYVQMKRYLRATNKILGLIVNFGEKSLNIKRIINKNN